MMACVIHEHESQSFTKSSNKWGNNESKIPSTFNLLHQKCAATSLANSKLSSTVGIKW